jgi:uncharacterized membrane protein YkvA (DUF1232 family)
VTALLALIGIAVGAGLLWVGVILVLTVTKPAGIDFAEAKQFVPDLVRLLRDLAREPDAGRAARTRIALLLVYLASPIDLIPDFIPVLGYADDVLVIALVLRSIARRAGPAAVESHWSGSDAGLRLLRQLAGFTSPA